MLKDLILKSRSYRRFHQDHKITKEELRELIDLARLTPSARNAQPLKFILSNTSEKNEKIFRHLTWAGYLTDWDGPEEGERPSAYIIVLLDNEITDNQYCDDGIAIQSIRLGATEKGLGGCIIAAIDKEQLRKDLTIPDKYRILYVLALGKPKETVVIEDMKNGDFRYWRSEDEIHHVPKRDLDEMIIS